MGLLTKGHNGPEATSDQQRGAPPALPLQFQLQTKKASCKILGTRYRSKSFRFVLIKMLLLLEHHRFA